MTLGFYAIVSSWVRTDEHYLHHALSQAGSLARPHELGGLARKPSAFRPWVERTLALGRILGFVIAFACAAVALAQEGSRPPGPLKFDIPAQSLIEALQAYSVQAEVQVMFETASAAGYRSGPVVGEFTPEVALRMLLADTDLKIHYSRASAITLAPASAPDPDVPPAHPWASADMALDTLRVSGIETVDQGHLGEYIGVVQADIQKALKRVPGTRRGNYRVAVKLWVDPSRIVQRAELDGSTGDHDRDSLIAQTLHGLVLSQQAPPNTPQPIRFLIAIHAL